MTEERHEFTTYADMAAFLRECKAKGITYWWNHDELMAGELIVYVRKDGKDRKENENG